MLSAPIHVMVPWLGITALESREQIWPSQSRKYSIGLYHTYVKQVVPYVTKTKVSISSFFACVIIPSLVEVQASSPPTEINNKTKNIYLLIDGKWITICFICILVF